MANLIAGQLGYRFVTQFIAQLSRRDSSRRASRPISPLVPIAAMLSPYIHAFSPAAPRVAAGDDSRAGRRASGTS